MLMEPLHQTFPLLHPNRYVRIGKHIVNPHRRAIEELYAHLHSGAEGLSQAEAARRLARYGANQIEEIAGQAFIGRLFKEFTHFFALILWLAAGLAFVAEWKDPGQGMAMLGYAVLGVILVNGLFSFWQEYRAEKALAALRNLLPRHTTALRDGKAVQLPVAELVPGDVVLLAAGDDVPADCRLIEAFGVRVNTATLTGESMPKARDAAGRARGAGRIAARHPACRHLADLRRGEGHGVRHRHAHRIRQHRAPDADRARAAVAAANRRSRACPGWSRCSPRCSAWCSS